MSELKELREFSDAYLNILTTRLAGLNLTRILEPEEFYLKQILDSVLPVEQCPEFAMALKNTKTVVDIGFGGGFPLLPLAKLYPEKNFVGLEARAKKADAVQSIADELGLKNVKCHHRRLETVAFDIEAVSTLKAVGTIFDFLKLFHVEQKQRVFFYKGPQVLELENQGKPPKTWTPLCQKTIVVPGADGRMILGFESQNVPRGTKKNKELVNLSSLI